MNYNLVALATFSSKLKKLAKKYKQIKIDMKELQEELQLNPKAGIALQHSCYKIRIANSSTPTGKSGGFRVVYYFVDNNNKIFLMTIYSKTQKDNLSENELLELLKINGLDQ